MLAHLSVTAKIFQKEVRGKKFKLQSDEIKAWRHDKKLVVGWRSKKKKPVLMVATTSSSAPTTVLAGRRRQSVTKPQVIVDYNSAMDGVDRADQYCVYYSFHRKTVKWWRKVLFWAIEVGIVNSYLLYKQIVKPPLTHLQYRRQLILSLCDTLPTGNIRRQLMHPLPTEERFQGRHYLQTGSSRRRCLVCGTSKSGERKKVTIYFCTTCSNHPALHPVPCFRRYHELRDYLQ